MPSAIRLILAAVVALAIGFGFRAFDGGGDAGWVVSPAQIAAAKAAGKPGYETSPGTVAVLPIRSETADILPFKWALAGLGAGGLVLAATRPRKTA